MSATLLDSPSQTQETVVPALLRQAVEAMPTEAAEELADPQLRQPCRKVLESLEEHWRGLVRFVDDPRIPMDNNASERAGRGPWRGRISTARVPCGVAGWQRRCFRSLPRWPAGNPIRGGGWWTTKGGVFYSLGTDKTAARKEFMRIHGNDVPVGGDLNVADVLDRYLMWSAANHSDKTHYRIKMNLESFSKSLPPLLRLRRLLPLHLTEWLDQRCPKKPPDGGKPISDNTRRGYASDVLGAFTWAVKQRLIASSPLQGFTKAPATGADHLPGPGADGGPL